MAVTPNMSITTPTVSVTAGPTYATQINTAVDTIDAHDHTTGKGVRVPSAGLNINADLSFGGNDATTLRSVAFSSQGSPLGVGDVNAVYVSGGNLYFNNGSGASVQITSGSTLNPTAAGGIGGDYVGSTALVSYSTATKTFTFTQATSTAALIDVGSVIIRKLTASSPGITILPDAALASGYTITLPAAPPGSTLPVSMSSSGVLSTAQVTTAQIGDSQVTRAKQASVGQQISAAVTSAAKSNTTYDDTGISNLSVSLTTTGRPVVVGLTSDAVGSGNISIAAAAGTIANGHIAYSVDGAVSFFFEGLVKIEGVGAAAGNMSVPPGAFTTIWAASAGSHTIKAYAKVTTGTDVLTVIRTRLFAYEL